MKKILSILIVLTLFLNCKKVEGNINNDSENSIDDIVSSTVDSLKRKSNTIEKCNTQSDEFKLFKSLNNDEINLKTVEPNLYYAISKVNFDTLFNTSNIKCVISKKQGKFSFFNFYYKSNIKNEYNRLNQLKRSVENLNKYHDFFKRGIVFVLDSENHKITMISFNIFADNSLPSKVVRFFKANKKDFEKVFMTTGIGTSKILVE